MKNKETGEEVTFQQYCKLTEDQKFGYWHPWMLESRGFKVKSHRDCWYHFVRDDYEILINMDAYETDGNYFNFKSAKGKWNGHFSVVLYSTDELDTLLEFFNRKRR